MRTPSKYTDVERNSIEVRRFLFARRLLMRRELLDLVLYRL